MPKHSMGDDSGSEDGSEADEKGFLSSRQVREQLAVCKCVSARQGAMLVCTCSRVVQAQQRLCTVGLIVNICTLRARSAQVRHDLVMLLRSDDEEDPAAGHLDR